VNCGYKLHDDFSKYILKLEANREVQVEAYLRSSKKSCRFADHLEEEKHFIILSWVLPLLEEMFNVSSFPVCYTFICSLGTNLDIKI
jgi:hypothetical protein